MEGFAKLMLMLTMLLGASTISGARILKEKVAQPQMFVPGFPDPGFGGSFPIPGFGGSFPSPGFGGTFPIPGFGGSFPSPGFGFGTGSNPFCSFPGVQCPPQQSESGAVNGVKCSP